jgi:hypothetical protein
MREVHTRKELIPIEFGNMREVCTRTIGASDFSVRKKLSIDDNHPVPMND